MMNESGDESDSLLENINLDHKEEEQVATIDLGLGEYTEAESETHNNKARVEPELKNGSITNDLQDAFTSQLSIDQQEKKKTMSSIKDLLVKSTIVQVPKDKLVTIQNPRKVTSNMQGYLVYEVVTQHAMVERRYTEFIHLRQYLLYNFPGAILPEAPPKTTMSRYKEEIVNERTRKLQYLLQYIMLDERLSKLEAVQNFLTNTSRFDKMDYTGTSPYSWILRTIYSTTAQVAADHSIAASIAIQAKSSSTLPKFKSDESRDKLNKTAGIDGQPFSTEYACSKNEIEKLLPHMSHVNPEFDEFDVIMDKAEVESIKLQACLKKFAEVFKEDSDDSNTYESMIYTLSALEKKENSLHVKQTLVALVNAMKSCDEMNKERENEQYILNMAENLKCLTSGIQQQLNIRRKLKMLVGAAKIHLNKGLIAYHHLQRDQGNEDAVSRKEEIDRREKVDRSVKECFDIFTREVTKNMVGAKQIRAEQLAHYIVILVKNKALAQSKIVKIWEQCAQELNINS